MMFFEIGQYSQGLVPLTLTTSISGTTMYSLKVPNLASCFILFPLHVNRVVPSSISALSNPKLKHKKKKQQRYFFITHPMYGNKRQFWILDCTYWIPDSRYWIPDCLSVDLYSVFQSLVGFRIPWAKFRIAQAQISRITDFHKQKFSLFRNPHNLSWGDIKVFNKIKLKCNSVAFILEDGDQLVVRTS